MPIHDRPLRGDNEADQYQRMVNRIHRDCVKYRDMIPSMTGFEANQFYYTFAHARRVFKRVSDAGYIGDKLRTAMEDTYRDVDWHTEQATYEAVIVEVIKIHNWFKLNEAPIMRVAWLNLDTLNNPTQSNIIPEALRNELTTLVDDLIAVY